MYNEKLASLTATHLRTHLSAYLAESNVEFTATDRVAMGKPTIDTRSMVGGVMAAELSELPFYGIDIINKSLAGITENLYTYQYTGHIGGLVQAGSQGTLDKLVKRHATAVERFIRRHLYLHEASDTGFRILSFEYVSSDFSGAELVEEEEGRQIWIGGFIANCVWTTSEDGPEQHA